MGSPTISTDNQIGKCGGKVMPVTDEQRDHNHLFPFLVYTSTMFNLCIYFLSQKCSVWFGRDQVIWSNPYCREMQSEKQKDGLLAQIPQPPGVWSLPCWRPGWAQLEPPSLWPLLGLWFPGLELGLGEIVVQCRLEFREPKDKWEPHLW